MSKIHIHLINYELPSQPWLVYLQKELTIQRATNQLAVFFHDDQTMLTIYWKGKRTALLILQSSSIIRQVGSS